MKTQLCQECVSDCVDSSTTRLLIYIFSYRRWTYTFTFPLNLLKHILSIRTESWQWKYGRTFKVKSFDSGTMWNFTQPLMTSFKFLPVFENARFCLGAFSLITGRNRTIGRQPRIYFSLRLSANCKEIILSNMKDCFFLKTDLLSFNKNCTNKNYFLKSPKQRHSSEK